MSNIMQGITENISNSDNFFVKLAKKSFAVITNPKTGQKLKRKGKKVYLLLTPQYNNLGDHAIAMASLRLLKSKFAEYEVVELTSNYYKNCKDKLLQSVSEEDILVIIGGGFMGDLWMTMENMVRDIIVSFPSNKVLILPQTVYFDDEKEYQESKNIYCGHKQLHLMVREEQSYELCKNEMGMKYVYLVPDIVLLLQQREMKNRSDKVGICFRGDKEKLECGITDEQIQKVIYNMGYEIGQCTTLLKTPYIFLSKREKLVNQKIEEVGSYKIMLTNRLHCMIFAYLSKTPCLAFDNKSKKVSGVYKWIKDCGFIHLYDGNKDFSKQLSELIGERVKINNLEESLRMYFDTVFLAIAES